MLYTVHVFSEKVDCDVPIEWIWFNFFFYSITVLPIPTHVSVGNVTTFAGKEVTIPINVTTDDGKPFTGKVTIRFPDGSTKVVNVINGNGKTTWFVPYDYTPGKYPDHVRFAGMKNTCLLKVMEP